MRKIPISIIIDDPAPIVHVYCAHHDKGGVLASGEKLLPDIPNGFLSRFCDVVETFGIGGKFSIVPMPGCRGDIVNGIDGHPLSEVTEWLDMARQRLSPTFAFCPEILTHHKAINLENGEFFEENEQEWASHQGREAIADYIARSLELLKQADIHPTGVTSPWAFGIEVEDAYVAAICDAFHRVYGAKKSWYFLHNNTTDRHIRPRVRYREEDRCVVEMITTARDAFWQTIDSPRTDGDYVSAVADVLLTADGKRGAIVDILARESYPILITHWQSLFSNGRETGLAALKEVATRLEKHLSDVVEWKSFDALMDEAIENDI